MEKKIKKYLVALIIIIILILLLIGVVFTNKKNQIKPNKNVKLENSYKYKNNKSDNTSTITENVSFEGETTYSINFNSNDGIGNMKSITCNHSKICKLPKNAFSKKGYQFMGWSLEKNGNVVLNDGSYFRSLSDKEDDLITLYAKWEKMQFSISFLDYNGKIISKEMQMYDDMVKFPTNPNRNGYTFIAWDNNTKKVEKDETYNAIYKINDYTISYDLDGGTLEKKVTTYNIESNDIHIEKPIKYGYLFTGWKVKDKNKIIEDYIIKKGSYGNVNLKAIYKPKQYKINFSSNGGSESFDSKIVNFQECYGPLPTPTKKGYTFTGWSYNDELVNNDTIVSDDNDIDLIANWDKNEYKITLDPNGGIVDQKETTVKYDEKYGELPIPKRDGYKFKGWSYNEKIIGSETILQIDQDHELKANWEVNNYNITYLNSNGTIYAQKTITATEKIPYLDYTVDQYHIFKGWKDSNGKDISEIKNPLINDITLKASVSETNCYLLTGQAQDGDTSRLTRFRELLLEKGLDGRFNLETTGYYSYVTTTSNYSHVISAANHLLVNASSKTWPNLRWLLISCDSGYAERLR